uniref:Uncharacterized protein n=1 Tax=Globodera pallida TaxID=36090 RepID=A0A183C4S9_GLOPA
MPDSGTGNQRSSVLLCSSHRQSREIIRFVRYNRSWARCRVSFSFDQLLLGRMELRYSVSFISAMPKNLPEMPETIDLQEVLHLAREIVTQCIKRIGGGA